MLSWIETPRKYDLEVPDSSNTYAKRLLITNKYEMIEDVPGISLTPLPHQRATVKAMVDTEKKQLCKIIPPTPYFKCLVESRAAVLSEPPGSGKTLEILMTIALNPKPPKKAEITSLPIDKLYSDRRSDRFYESFVDRGATIVVTKTYNTVFPQTLIFVGKSVLTQWIETIRKYTKFRLLVINDIHSLRDFYKSYTASKKKTIGKYDIILVKNGNISGKFDVKELIDSPIEYTKSKPIITVFGELFKKVCWARVVLDDFDCLAIPTSAKSIPALFTWFVSATKRASPGKKTVPRMSSITELLTDYRPYYTNAWFNRELFTFFNISSEKGFIDESTSATVVKFYTYVFDNPNEKYMDLLNVMGMSDTVSIVEKLNNDAIEEAAKEVNIDTKSIPDVFEKILDQKWKTYSNAESVLAYLEKVRRFIKKYANRPAPESDRSRDGDNNSGVTAIRNNCKARGPLSQIKKILGNDESISSMLSDLEEEYKQIRDENGKALQRVKDNIRHGECPITAEKLSDVKNVVILKCCGNIISGDAVLRGLKMTTSNGGKDAVGECPCCRRRINFSGLIFIDRDKIFIDDLLCEENELDAIENEVNGNKDAVDEISQKKYECIVNIILGEDIPERVERKDINIPNLLRGNKDRGTSDNRKIIIFANFRETMQIVEAKLIDNGIPYLKVMGSALQIQDIIHRYGLPNDNEESINILLVSGPKYVAGLNLQMTTDLIFTGKITNINIESQIAGRICRIGRNSNPSIHYVLYKNEQRYL